MSGNGNPRKALGLIAVIGIFIGSSVLISSAAKSSENNPKNGEILKIDYANRYYKTASFAVHSITDIKINDLRQPGAGSGEPSFAGLLKGETSLFLDVSVKEFVEKSFAQMLVSDGDTARYLQVELNIEEFQLDQTQVSLLNNEIGFDGKISITVISGDKRINAGYLQNYSDADVPSNINENLTDLMYQGMVVMAEQLAQRINVAEVKPRGASDIDIKPVDEPEFREDSYLGEGFSYLTACLHLFAGDRMKDDYESAIGFGAQGGYWSENRMGFWGTFTLGKATGTPARSDESWDVSSSKMKMYFTSVGGSFLYSLRKNPAKSIFNPFVGVGLTGIFGLDKVEASASRTVESVYEEFKEDVWSVRAAFASHILFGSRYRITDKVTFLVETRWIQSGKGGAAELKKEEELESLDIGLYDAVRKPAFDFTGWSVGLGLEW